MSQLIEFAANHLILVSAFVFISTLLLVNIAQGGGARSIYPIQAVQMLNREDAVLIDIRDASDYDAGHIINAKNIPRAELKSRLDELKKFKERPIVVYCANGSASTAALRELSSAGFEQVHSLKGGLSAWRSDNLPLT
mgnify:CR=1 FL=1|jgi:rhodanese-related sulfurtransferase